MSDLEAKIEDELRRIIDIVSAITQLPSRWSGRAELAHNADYRGRKPFSCDIFINMSLANDDARWPTLIHEAFHTVSAGYIASDYRTFRGWEEGVAEQLQRLFRSDILARLNVQIDEAQVEFHDTIHQYNDYIEALERIRALLDMPEQAFYLDVLRTPIKDRPASILSHSYLLAKDERTEFVRIFSACNAILKGFQQIEPNET